VLEKFLRDSFALPMSSISVMEAGSINEQAQQGQMITRLTFLYVPLSFVTGIFGMNVKEINGSPLPIWVPVAHFLLLARVLSGFFSSGDGSRPQGRLLKHCFRLRLTNRGLGCTRGVVWRGKGVLDIPVSVSSQSGSIG
jgi:hypothetical protein